MYALDPLILLALAEEVRPPGNGSLHLQRFVREMVDNGHAVVVTNSTRAALMKAVDWGRDFGDLATFALQKIPNWGIQTPEALFAERNDVARAVQRALGVHVPLHNCRVLVEAAHLGVEALVVCTSEMKRMASPQVELALHDGGLEMPAIMLPSDFDTRV